MTTGGTPPAGGDGGGGTGGGAATTPTAMGTNVWDVVRAALVLGALVGLTVFLVSHYKDSKDVTSVLGVVAPVLAAIVGVTLGYYSGNQAGTSKGAADKEQAVKAARKSLAQQVKPVVEQVDADAGSVVDRIVTVGASEPGSGVFRVGPDALQLAGDLSFDAKELHGTREAVAHLRGLIASVETE